MKDIFKIKNFKVIRRLKPVNFIGDEAKWDGAQVRLNKVLGLNKIDYETRPREGIFYGPKIDFGIAYEKRMRLMQIILQGIARRTKILGAYSYFGYAKK